MRARLAPDRQDARARSHSQDASCSPVTASRYGHRVMTAAITLHDHDYPIRYMTAA